jgi:hypothetical protein
MRKNNFVVLFFLSVAFCTGCRKNNTNFYADAEDKGLGIFSNTGNNLFSCYIDNLPWRTLDRILGSPGGTSYEIYINKQISNTQSDTLIINWLGLYGPRNATNGNLRLLFPIAKNFGYKDLTAWNGQRLKLDTTNGYFSISTNLITAKGTGTIYFKQLQIDSIGVNTYSGRLSGLVEASFAGTVLSKGRFDHLLEPTQINF